MRQQQGFGRFSLVTRWKRVYREPKANEVWYLLTNLDSLEEALQCYSQRFSIEPMFRDFKSGGYNLEDCRLTGQRFLAIVLLISRSLTPLPPVRVKRLTTRYRRVSPYVGRVKEPGRTQKRHSDFWIGLYGHLWIDAIRQWSSWAHQLMRLKPQKRIFFLRGLKAMSLIQSAL